MRTGKPQPPRPGREAGYSYLVMIVLVAVFGVGLAAVMPVWSQRM